MKIYLDYIFLENLIINLILTLQINYFTKRKNKKINIILGVVFLSFYTTIIYVLENTFLNSLIIKLIAVIIYSYITFVPKTIIILVKDIIYYFLFSFIYVGIIISISLIFKISLDNLLIKILTYIISSAIVYIFTKNLWKMWKINIKNNNLMYVLNIGGKRISAFVDTGHNVKDVINNLDVIFVDSKYKEDLIYYLNKNKKVEINISTINKGTKEEGYIFENICVYKDNKIVAKIKKIIVCFVNNSFENQKYSALISYNTYMENLKGVMFC